MCFAKKVGEASPEIWQSPLLKLYQSPAKSGTVIWRRRNLILAKHSLHDALVALGLATCGELTSRLTPKLGMTVKPTTILRRLRAVPFSPVGTVRILGVDDFGATRSYMCSCKNS